MSLYDTLTGINTTTFTLVLTLFGLTFLPWLKLNKWLKVMVRVITILTMGYFLLVGWRTLDYDSVVPYKGKHITFPDGKFKQICNLKKLYYLDGYEYRVSSRDISLSFDCIIRRIKKNTPFSFKNNSLFIRISQARTITDKELFLVKDSFKTNSVGLGASFGNSGVQFFILKRDNRSYMISGSNFEDGDIK